MSLTNWYFIPFLLFLFLVDGLFSFPVWICKIGRFPEDLLLLSGALTVIIWDYIPLIGGQTPYVATGLYSLVVGFIISLLFIIVVSLITKAPEESIVEEFETYKAYKE